MISSAGLVETCLAATPTLRAFRSWVASFDVAGDADGCRRVHDFFDVAILVVRCFENWDVFLYHSINVPCCLVASNSVDSTL